MSLKLSLAAFVLTLSRAYSQAELTRSAMLLENISIVKIYIPDDERQNLKTVHFINDSGLIFKSIHFSPSSEKTDTSMIEYYSYDSLNRTISYQSKQFLDSNFFELKYTYIYYEKGYAKINHQNNDSTIKLIYYKKRGNVYRNYINNRLYAKSIRKKFKRELIYHFYFPDTRKIIYKLDKSGRTLQSDTYYSGSKKNRKYNRITYTYDKTGKCIKCCIQNNLNEPTSYCKFYEYLKKS